MGHKVPGCLLVKLFALHTTKFQDIFMNQRIRKVKKPKEVAADEVVLADNADPPAPPESAVVNYLCRTSTLLIGSLWCHPCCSGSSG